MILKALTLENFKGIREPVRIEFAPLTLLFGPNNAGKSTVLHALMYAREILERNNPDAKITQLGGDVVDLGGFKNLVYGHDLSRNIKMRFELENIDLPDYFQFLKNTDYQEFIRMGDFSYWYNEGPMPTFDEASKELRNIWIQMEITWSIEHNAPIVNSYQVGKENAPYASIDLYPNRGAAISFIDFSISPFGKIIYSDIYALDTSDLGIDDIPDILSDITSYPAEAPFNTPPDPVEWKGRLREYKYHRAEHTTSWLDALFNRSTQNMGLVPYKDFDDCYLPLQIQGGVLPDFDRPLPIPPEVWHVNDDYRETDYDIEQEIINNPAFGWGYLTGFLTSVISGPGKRLMELLRDSLYISSLRRIPDRTHQLSDFSESYSWANGLAAWHCLTSADKALHDNINSWLGSPNRFNSGYQVEIDQYKEIEIDGDLFGALNRLEEHADFSWIIKELHNLPEGRRLWIKDSRSGAKLLPRDLGVGISRIFPVIVAALHKQSGLVAIEEPESNTHPAFQVVLGDLFISQAKKNPGLLFLIETHSEHLMLRCLRRIRETRERKNSEDLPAVTPDDISVHFVEPSQHGSRIHRIHIDEDGDFADPWPLGFFPERFKELYGDDL